jgi:hypothetical protein
MEQQQMSPTNVDWFLQVLVEMANRGDTSFPITLNVGGLLISGNIVAGQAYFEGLADSVAESMTGVDEQTREEVKKEVAEAGGMVYSSDAPGGQPHFIHLRDARIFAPPDQQVPVQKSVYWRGRLDAVQGFTFGTLDVGAKGA